jgi:Restriction Enzyme Adenine Methylase Associated
MPQIDIDFEVFKELTSRRPSEDVTYNDVVRELLKLPRPLKSVKSTTNGHRPWIVSDTSFPPGTEFTADYKGKTFSGLVKDGKLELSDGSKFSTPSAAAVHITNTNVNGWRFWRCRLPGSPQYVLIERLRGKAHA